MKTAGAGVEQPAWMMRLLVLLVFAAATGCWSQPRPAAPAAPAPGAEPAPAPAPPVRSEPAAPNAAAHACDEEGRTVWDDAAGECRINPSYGWGHAGCSMQHTPAPPPGKCVTGTHWDSCGCSCDQGTWNEDMTRCE